MLPGREADKWIPGGDGAGVHFHCPPCLSDVCSFMTDCIRPDRTSVADMWTIENVLRLRLYTGRGIRICSGYVLYAGEGNKNMSGYVLHAGGMKICLDMFCMRRNKNMPWLCLHAGKCRKD